MTKRLQTTQVFLDTEVFIAANFQFSSGRLKRLADFSRNGKITLYSTDITIREIKANITKRIQEINNSFKKFLDKARILKDVPSCASIFDFDLNIAIKDLENQLEEFLASSGSNLLDNKINIISTNSVNIELIFDKYFQGQPPFGVNKKKHEFPDAFVIAALEKWCRENSEYMYVISDDNDMQTACSISSFLRSLEKPEALFELITSEDEYISSFAHQWFTEQQNKIEQEITDNFEQSGFSLVDKYDGEVNGVTVSSIDLTERNLVEIQDGVLYFAVIAKITFSAEVSYPDPDMSVYDSETGDVIVLDTIEETIERTTKAPVEVEITFCRDEPHNPEVTSVDVEVGDIIEIELDKYLEDR